MSAQGQLSSEAACYTQPVAESTTRAFLDLLERRGAPAMETLSPREARGVLADALAALTIELAPAEVSKKTIEVDGVSIRLAIVRPVKTPGKLPAFMFFHGGGWVIGDFPTHERFVRDLVAASGTVAVFVEYALSPEARYPVAIQQAYTATRWVAERGHEIGVDGTRLAVVGNSAGGNMAAVVALRAKLQQGPRIRQQILLWPVADARFDTASYKQFQTGYFVTLGMMQWFWNHYTVNLSQRNEIFASPLRASFEQLQGLPPTLIQTAELDVLRDEGEAYARKLSEAGVDVVSSRFNGMVHDFGLLEPLRYVPAVQAAMQQVALALKQSLA